ncbi:MAG: multicopper oxidase domain-containing protein [Rhizobiales bacterium]|nr:multicopper oxidase domain-containing protein [Hyphomicrobiales bacterium]
MLTRRAFISSAVIGSSNALLTAKWAFGKSKPFERSLPIPPLIDARSVANKIGLIAAEGRHKFFPNQPTATSGYSGAILGPTLRFHKGDEIAVTVENKLERHTTVHWHGLLIPSISDGGPHNPIAPGTSWRTTLKIDQPESTAWFHPHPHGDTARQVYSGLAGMVLLDDGSSERLGLPRTYGVDDIPLLLQERQFNSNGSLRYDDGPQTTMLGARGDTVIVNGAIAPVARVPVGLVRLRLLNGSNARNYDLSFSDTRAFHVIASDGGYLPSPVRRTRLIISPGERFEVLVDFSDARSVILETGADQFIPMMGMMSGDVSGAAQIIKFEPDPTKVSKVHSIPAKLSTMSDIGRVDGLRRRQFVLNDHMMGMMGMRFRNRGLAINGSPYDINRIDTTVSLGSSEIWEVESGMMAHPFHIHGVQFRILSIDGRRPPMHLQGYKDTVLVLGSAEILVPFTQRATREHPFMYHCHILEHEDAGMMGQYVAT